jgi:hypothetical protein
MEEIAEDYRRKNPFKAETALQTSPVGRAGA